MAKRKLNTPVGTIYAAADSSGVTYLGWRMSSFDHSAEESNITGEILDEVGFQLSQFFSGQLRKFDLPRGKRKQGTHFQEKVWSAISEVGYGSLTSYREIAHKIGSPNAVRAVGTACGANPISIIVPCHRVIRSDGKLGGYGGGLYKKKQLLLLERGDRQ